MFQEGVHTGSEETLLLGLRRPWDLRAGPAPGSPAQIDCGLLVDATWLISLLNEANQQLVPVQALRVANSPSQSGLLASARWFAFCILVRFYV